MTTCITCQIHERMRGRLRCEDCAKLADAAARERKNKPAWTRSGFNPMMAEWAKKRLR